MGILVGVIDYGMGNLHSVAKAIALQGGNVFVTDNRAKLKKADLLVLPGVGAFGAAIKTLGKKKLDDLVVQWIEDDRPYLGICLGFQMLFEKSEESPREKGLGVLKGNVVKFRPAVIGRRLQIPHMGWNQAIPKQSLKKTPFENSKRNDSYYFVHSYYPQPKDKNVIMTETNYGKNFCSSVFKGNLFATQFHPEKSGAVGLRLLKNVLGLVR